MELASASFRLPVQRLHDAEHRFDLWCCRTEDVPAGVYDDPEGSGWLSSQEFDRLQRFRFRSLREQFVQRRVLVRSVLSQYADVLPREWTFTAGAFGRPEISAEVEARLAESGGGGRLSFNLSRSGSLAVCAVSRSCVVGVDVEGGRRSLGMELAQGVLAENERRDLASLPEGERPPELLRYWVLKEAYLKARGCGLSVDPRSIAFEGPGSESPRLVLTEDGRGCLEEWSFRALREPGSFALAVALAFRSDSEEVQGRA